MKKEEGISEFGKDQKSKYLREGRRDGWKEDIPSKVLEYIVLELYRLGEISSGKAAEYLDL